MPSAHAANGITKANKMYSVYSTILRIGGEKIRGGTDGRGQQTERGDAQRRTRRDQRHRRVARQRRRRPYLAAAPISAVTAIADQDDRVAPVAKSPGAQDENGGHRSQHDQLRPLTLTVRGHREPRRGHRDGGDAEQYAGQHRVGLARSGGHLLAA